MLLEKYEYKAEDSTLLQYSFESTGPNGNIKKYIIYTYFKANDKHHFNLGFGDWDEEQQTLSDLTVSNNSDREKILFTVADTIFQVTDQYPNHKIYIEGSTLSRTRLYQMSIAFHLNEINNLFVIEGQLNNYNWETFNKGQNYRAFLVTRK